MKIAAGIISKGRVSQIQKTVSLYENIKRMKKYLFVDKKEYEDYLKGVQNTSFSVIPFDNVSYPKAVNFAIAFLSEKGFKHALLSDDDLRSICLWDDKQKINRKMTGKEIDLFFLSAYRFHKKMSSPLTGFLQRGFDTRSLAFTSEEFRVNKKMGGVGIFDINIFDKMEGYDERLKIYSDTDYLLRLYKKGFCTFQFIGKKKGYISFRPMGRAGGLYEVYQQEKKDCISQKILLSIHSDKIVKFKINPSTNLLSTKVAWKKAFFTEAKKFLKSLNYIIFVEPHYDDVLLSCSGFFEVLNVLKIPWDVWTVVDNEYNSFCEEKDYRQFGAKEHFKMKLNGIDLFALSKKEKTDLFSKSDAEKTKVFLEFSGVKKAKIINRIVQRGKLNTLFPKTLIIPKGIKHIDHIAVREIFKKFSRYHYIDMPYSFSIDKKPKAITVEKKELLLEKMKTFNKKDAYPLMIRFPERFNQAIIGDK